MNCNISKIEVKIRESVALLKAINSELVKDSDKLHLQKGFGPWKKPNKKNFLSTGIKKLKYDMKVLKAAISQTEIKMAAYKRKKVKYLKEIRDTENIIGLLLNPVVCMTLVDLKATAKDIRNWHVQSELGICDFDTYGLCTSGKRLLKVSNFRSVNNTNLDFNVCSQCLVGHVSKGVWIWGEVFDYPLYFDGYKVMIHYHVYENVIVQCQNEWDVDDIMAIIQERINRDVSALL